MWEHGQPTIPLGNVSSLGDFDGEGGISSVSQLGDTLPLCPAAPQGQTYALQQGVPTL